MSGDYSRFTFEPRKRFSGVLMQQGRVQLDSDWNEQTDLLRDRVRVLGLDSGGPAWVAHLTTPDAFKIGALGGPPPDLSIGVGRIYVDGRLAEVFPDEGVTYLHQPFMPTPPALTPALDTLVYLDLWEREITWSEDTRLLDVALGGVDTTTRVQQVWQVKLLNPESPAACGFDLNAAFPPSAGRLTVTANAPPAPDDPCVLPPNAGYRGIENRLYRVEVQTGGPLGTATFKWSRDNASIVSRVSAIAVAGGQSRITVNRIGRDEVLRFRIGDWVTLTDDHRELNGEAGQMARVIDIDEAHRVVVLDRAVPTGGTRAFGATAAEIATRNSRLQRWDQKAPANVLDADGLMTTAAGPIDLEDGIRVSFGAQPAAGLFHVGDYWVFAARTADASVEPLDQAPPRGIGHQYLQLAAIPAGGVPTDCRPPAPQDEGCCTFVVAPGEDIQQAIDDLPPAGGCVCLKAGVHEIRTPLLIQKDNVALHGESLGAIVVNPLGTGVLIVAGTWHDRVHDVVFRQLETTLAPAIRVRSAHDLCIADCRIEVQPVISSMGVFAEGSADLTIAGCHFSNPGMGIHLEACRDVTVRDCELNMAPPGPHLPTNAAITALKMDGPVTVADNMITGAINGVIVNDATSGQPFSSARLTQVTGNRLELSRAPAGQAAFGIDTAAPESIVTGNQITHDRGALVAIRLCGSGSRASGNSIAAVGEEIGISVGIVAGFENNGQFLPLEQIEICGNILEGPQHGIIVAGAVGGRISGNLIGRSAMRTGFGILLNHVSDCVVSENELGRPQIGIMSLSGARNSLVSNSIMRARMGIVVGMEEAPTIGQCRLEDVERIGIAFFATTQRAAMIENRVIRCGAQVRSAIAIAAFVVFGEWHVEANEVLDTGLSKDPGGPTSALAYGILGLLVREARVDSNLVTYSNATQRKPSGEDRALLMMGAMEYSQDFAAGTIEFGFPIQISDNKFIGTGSTALVELLQLPLSDSIFMRFERVLVSGNYCWHFSDLPGPEKATVSLRGKALSVSANQIKATTAQFPSWHLHRRPATFLGNVSHGPTLDRGLAKPGLEGEFNLIV